MIAKILIKVFLLAIISLTCHAQQFTLKGSINSKDEKIFLSYYSPVLRQLVVDSAMVSKDGLFYFRGEISNFIAVANLRINKTTYFPLFVEPKSIEIKIETQSNSIITMGSQYQKIYDSLKLKTNDTKKKIDEINYIYQNPSSLVSMYLLQSYYSKVSFDSLEYIYNNIRTNDLMTIFFKEQLLKKIAARKNGAVNSLGYNFKTLDINGNDVELSDYLGSYVILDFWASWCIPCRVNNPQMLSLYNQYKNKGLIVLGISIDKNLLKWNEAVKDDKLPWSQIHENIDEIKISDKYDISVLPTYILVDTKGIVLGRYVADLLGLKKRLDEIMR